MTETIPALWREGDTERLARVMTGDTVFSSPVADYRGAEAGHIVGLIPQTMDRIDVTQHWDDGRGDTVTAFTALVGEDPIDGVVRERRDAGGALTHVTLFLRPLHVLDNAITHIKALRRQYPVPTRRG